MSHKGKLISGDKKNTKWLLADSEYICHICIKKFGRRVLFFGESKYSKSEQCLFKIVTMIETAWWCVHKKTAKEFLTQSLRAQMVLLK